MRVPCDVVQPSCAVLAPLSTGPRSLELWSGTAGWTVALTEFGFIGRTYEAFTEDAYDPTQNLLLLPVILEVVALLESGKIYVVHMAAPCKA